MAKAKSKQKKGKKANLSKVRKKGSIKKRATAKVRKDGKKKAVRKKAASRTRTTRGEKMSGPAAFTEIASEEALGEQETIGSTGVGKSEFTSTDSNSDTNSL